MIKSKRTRNSNAVNFQLTHCHFLWWQWVLVINWDTGQSIWCVIGDGGFISNGWGEVSINVLWETGHPDHMTANHANGISSNYEIIVYSGKKWRD